MRSSLTSGSFVKEGSAGKEGRDGRERRAGSDAIEVTAVFHSVRFTAGRKERAMGGPRYHNPINREKRETLERGSLNITLFKSSYKEFMDFLVQKHNRNSF